VKKCTKCGLFKLRDEFYTRTASKDGKSYWCKECSIEYRNDNADIRKIKQSIYNKKNKYKMNKKSKDYYYKNKSKINEQGKLYREKNKEKMKELYKNYYENNREYKLEYSKKYRELNKEYILKKRKEYDDGEWRTVYKEKNKGIYANYAANRRFSKKEATPIWSELDKIKILYEKCKWLESITGLKYHVDHIIPLNHPDVCGLHVWANLQILEASLNCSKGNKL